MIGWDLVTTVPAPAPVLHVSRTGNTINLSSFSESTALYFALYMTRVSSNVVYGSFIQGSTAVYISASTGTTFGGSVLVATNTYGNALDMDQGSVNLTLSSSV